MEKDYEFFILAGLVGLGILALFLTGLDFFGNNFLETENIISNIQPIITGAPDSGGVSVELTPKGKINGNLVISASFNTHSIDLSQFNLKETTVLEYGGKKTKPISVPVLNGHHANGEFIFDVEKDISEFTIKITGIPNIKERTFRWK